MLESILKEKLKEKKLLLMTHLVIGYPSFEDNWAMLEEMEKAGADLVELQFPFSEPVADGPLFIKANQASLDAGTTIEQCFDFMAKASQRFSFPILMMGYYNTVYAMGESLFCKKVNDAGGKGMIVPDLPIEESTHLFEEAKQNDLSSILIMTPNSTKERKEEIAKHSSGFIYCVARKGVTGLNTNFNDEVTAYLQELRSITSLPIALGFGVRTHEDLKFLEGKADIAIIGSAALEAYEQGGRQSLAKLLSWSV